MNTAQKILRIARRELALFSTRPILLNCMVVAPLVCLVFFTTLMRQGVPTDLPAGVVDEDRTIVSRTVVRTLDAMEVTHITRVYTSFAEAKRDLVQGRIYAIFHIPRGTTELAEASRQPTVGVYTNEAYLLPGTLLMKELRTGGELAGLAVTQANLRARGVGEDPILGTIRPIVIEMHALGNPTLDYGVYLNNMLLPGIFILLIMLTTAYAIGFEWKRGSQREVYLMGGCSEDVVLSGKLLPQTLWYSFLFCLMDVWLFRFCGYPCQCGLGRMMLLGVLTVVAAQAFAVFFFGLFLGQLRLAMCLCSLWGILSFSLAGFTYPVTAMHPVLQALSWLFPLRHYYLIYVNQALNGYALACVWPSVAALLLFFAFPLITWPRYRWAFRHQKYVP